ncbi:MAG: glycogen/starch/alpha-glucan phosphorylase [Candidatus Nezhaarchaeota archaeon]|nr:glycogen/starch/alpha-glucan phosphorylase [Candidatus Nezhaarchaeota archaeon]MCX8142172.1 glycogen/starch/alpha-glucan phosphorylase [Candidatus Nezhaarchaeota archaeon]MDW8050045.1 glycogen/starch/alpha-glucan phosphorylase [Nitrososphaerota archaeon]
MSINQQHERLIISITPDLAVDGGYNYAGGLGVLEGDKFHAASKLKLRYLVFSLLYRNGYVDYTFDEEGKPIPQPQPQPREFIDKLRCCDEFKLKLKGEIVRVKAFELSEGKAKAIFFSAEEPEWATKLTDRLYIESSAEERFYKYTLLAKASETYIRRAIPLDDIEYIDLQEAYAAMLPLSLRIPGKYRLVIHTAGPWGHPTFSRELFKGEYGYLFVDQDIVLTEIGLSASKQAFAVSAKHLDIILKVFPHHSEKLTYVTNGINLDRWMDKELRREYENHELTLDRFVNARLRLKNALIDLLRGYKDIDYEDKFIVLWSRRVVAYKRPDFPVRLILDAKDLPVIFVLGGKAHPHDGKGLEYMKLFMKLHREIDNVVYIPNYTRDIAATLLGGADLLLFTPFSGWEACGTSYMKAAVNGVPTLSSRDGGVLEFLVDGINGWLFGEDIRTLIDYYSPEAQKINEREYAQFRDLFFSIHELYRSNPEGYYKVGSNALRTFVARANMERVIKEYYPGLVKPLV